MPRADLRQRFSAFAQLQREIAGSERSWLSDDELDRLGQFRNPRRRAAWTWGRVLSKRILLEEWSDRRISPREITIRSHDEDGRGIAPVVQFDGIPQTCGLSISHTDRAVFVAASTDGEPAFGVDLVDLTDPKFNAASMRFWFTPRERQQIDHAGSQASRLFWAVKEAAFKACLNDEPFAPRQIEVAVKTPAAYTACCRFPQETRYCEVALRVHSQHVIAVAIETVGITNNKQHNRIHHVHC